MTVWIRIFIMAGVTYLIRVLPLTLLRKPIHSVLIRSFLYYVPYVTLAVMTFPAILEATSPAAGILAFLTGIVMTWFGAGLFPTAAALCAVVFFVQMI